MRQSQSPCSGCNSVRPVAPWPAVSVPVPVMPAPGAAHRPHLLALVRHLELHGDVADARAAAISVRIPSSTPGWASRSGTTAWPLIATTPLTTVQTWRSCTAPPPARRGCGAGRRPWTTWRGTASSRMSVLSRSSRQAPARISSESAIETIGSASGPAGEPDDRRRAERADRAEGVAQDVEVGAPGVEASLRATPWSMPRLTRFTTRPAGRDDQEQPGPDRLGVLDPLDRLDHHPGGDAEERGAVHQRGEDLPPEVAVGLAVVGGPLGDPGGEQAEAQRADVGEHVPRVGQQGQRAAEPTRRSPPAP